MEFKVENEDKNIKITLVEDNEIKAKATCYFENTPKVNGQSIGCIGEFESVDIDSGVKILDKCEEILSKKNIKLIVSPMNGNTWNKYRTIKYSNGDNLFLLENVNSIEYNDILIKAGFKELYTYTSTKGLVKDAYKSKAIEIASKKLKDKNITIRNFNKENYIEDFRKIYNISKVSFYRNPFYTPIDEQSFLNQYEKYLSVLDEDFILIAEKEGKEIGFIFGIPNYNELKEGKILETLIMKTVAVVPEYENLAIGHILFDKIIKKAEERQFKEWIFAFMYSGNTSQKAAKRNNTKVIREYAIYGKEI